MNNMLTCKVHHLQCLTSHYHPFCTNHDNNPPTTTKKTYMYKNKFKIYIFNRSKYDKKLELTFFLKLWICSAICRTTPSFARSHIKLCRVESYCPQMFKILMIQLNKMQKLLFSGQNTFFGKHH